MTLALIRPSLDTPWGLSLSPQGAVSVLDCICKSPFRFCLALFSFLSIVIFDFGPSLYFLTFAYWRQVVEVDAGGIAERAGLTVGMSVMRLADEPATANAQVHCCV